MATDEAIPTLKILLIGPSGAGKSARTFLRFRIAPSFSFPAMVDIFGCYHIRSVARRILIFFFKSPVTSRLEGGGHADVSGLQS